MNPALNMYNEIMDDVSQRTSGAPRWTSVGHFMRSEVLFVFLFFLTCLDYF